MTTQRDQEHAAMFEMVASAYRMLEMLSPKLEALDEAAQRIESVGIVLNPNMLRDYMRSDNAQAQVRIARACLRFLGEMRAEIKGLPS
jgi:phosphopantetheine adenylyltransferase